MSRTNNISKESKKVHTRKRKSNSGDRDVLAVYGKEDGYMYRTVNDTSNRIQNLLDNDWELAPNSHSYGMNHADDSKSIDSRVTKNVGGGTEGVLMRIRKEWYDEDQAAKAKDIDESEADLRSRLNNGENYGKVDIT